MSPTQEDKFDILCKKFIGEVDLPECKYFSCYFFYIYLPYT